MDSLSSLYANVRRRSSVWTVEWKTEPIHEDISSRGYSSKANRGDSPVSSPRLSKKTSTVINEEKNPPSSPRSPKPWRTPPTRVRRASSGETFRFSESRGSPVGPRRFVFQTPKDSAANQQLLHLQNAMASPSSEDDVAPMVTNQTPSPPPSEGTRALLPPSPRPKPIVRLEPVKPGHEETLENGGTCFEFGQESKCFPVSSPMAKSVSFHSGTSLPEERKISSAFDCLHFMMKGCSLLKVRASSRQYRRYFTLDEDLQSIRWVPSSKKSNKAKLPISHIREVRLGKTTDILRDKEITGCYSEDCVFSVIYGDSYDSLDLVASTADEANFWVTGISMLMASGRQSVNMDNIDERQLMREKWLQECFRQADTDRKGLLEESETIALAKKINSQLSTVRLRQKIQEFSIESGERTGRIDQNQFVLLFKDLATRPEVFFLMVRYSGKDYFARDDLHFFLEGEQEIETNEEDVVKFINEFEPSEEARKDQQMLLDGFTLFLLSHHSSLMQKSRVVQDMSQPLTNYYVSTSYKTYQLENMNDVMSNVEGYVQALTQGCRCVKLDLTSTGGKFFVGETLPLEEVLDALRDFAFAASKYPLIVHIKFGQLSHEEACGLAQQLKHSLGEYLYIPANGCPFSVNASPESLTHKILLYFTSASGCSSSSSSSSSSNNNSRKENKNDEWDFAYSASELAELAALNQTVFVDCATSQSQQLENEVCLLTEANALKLCHTQADDFVQHCKRFLTHVEPQQRHGSEDANQVNPLELWAAGVQLASTNFQQSSAPMDIYRGWFSQNGRCGYVLKPSCLRQPWTVFNAFKKEIINDTEPMYLRIKLISGQQLPLPRGASVKASSIDPYVMLQVFGIPNDCAEARTKTVSNEGQNPIFDESFEFTITAPQLAVLRLTVLDDDFIGDDFIGQRSLPVSCLRPGYRHVTLLADSGHPLLNATLFVHVTISSRSSNDKKLRRKRSWQTKMVSAGSGIADLRPTGLKPVDETCKNGATLLSECAKLKAALDKAMIELCEECGLSTSSNLAQCLRVLVQRLAGCQDISAFSISTNGAFPEVQITGEPTGPKSAKCLQCFERVLQECTYIVQNSSQLSEGLKDLYKNIQLHATELPSLCLSQKSKKADKASENFIWNASFIESRIESINSLTLECQTYLNQITRLRKAAERIFHREKSLLLSANQSHGAQSSGPQRHRASSSLSITPPVQQTSAPCTPPPVSPGPDPGRPHSKKGILKKPSSPIQISQQDLATSL